jgi:hypothetical protein
MILTCAMLIVAVILTGVIDADMKRNKKKDEDK